MKALTLHEPWASLMAHGHKTIETRSWYTAYRGPLAIHAGKTIDREWADGVEYLFLDPDGYRYGSGEFVAVASLTACIRMTQDFIANMDEREMIYGHYEVGRYAWKVEDVHPLEVRLVARGMQGLWTPRDNVRRLLLDA